MAGQVTVQLGDVEYVVRPQRIGYLVAKLSLGDVVAVQQGESRSVYRFVSVLVPDYGKRVAEHEFFGYASKDAYETGDYDEEKDASPYPDQVTEVLEKIVLVSGGERIKNWLGPAVAQGLIQWALEELLTRSSVASQSSLPPSGASDPTSSGTSAPTTETPATSA
jgi:hypothetical protein